jgi:hypothetical protein
MRVEERKKDIRGAAKEGGGLQLALGRADLFALWWGLPILSTVPTICQLRSILLVDPSDWGGNAHKSVEGAVPNSVGRLRPFLSAESSLAM